MAAWFPLLMVALTFLAVGAVVLGAGSLLRQRIGPEQKSLKRLLQGVSRIRYGDAPGRIEKSGRDERSAVLRRLLELPAASAIDLMVIRSGSQRTAGEIIALSLGLGILGFVLAVTVLGQGIGGGVILGLVLWALPLWNLKREADKRRIRFENQLPDALDFLSRSLRAGHGFLVALGMVGEEFPEPLGREFKTVFDESNFGAPLDEAFGRMAARVDSPDLNFFVVAVIIQRETGGNLAELLGSLASTVRERIKLVGKVRILSAEGRLSGIVLSSLPFVLGGILYLLNPDYVSLLWTTPVGKNILSVVLGTMVVGFFWMGQTVRIKV